MTVKQIEKNWIANFRKSPLVTDGIFNVRVASKLFNGFSNDHEFPFEQGFCDFHNNFNYSNVDDQVEELIKYLHFIGITIKKQSILSSVQNGTCSISQVLKKAFYIFKHLSNYNKDLDLTDPYYDNMGDLFFFLRLEEGDCDYSKQITLFDELELPDFYNKYIELPKGYEEDKTAKELFNMIVYRPLINWTVFQR